MDLEVRVNSFITTHMMIVYVAFLPHETVRRMIRIIETHLKHRLFSVCQNPKARMWGQQLHGLLLKAQPGHTSHHQRDL